MSRLEPIISQQKELVHNMHDLKKKREKLLQELSEYRSNLKKEVAAKLKQVTIERMANASKSKLNSKIHLEETREIIDTFRKELHDDLNKLHNAWLSDTNSLDEESNLNKENDISCDLKKTNMMESKVEKDLKDSFEFEVNTDRINFDQPNMPQKNSISPEFSNKNFSTKGNFSNQSKNKQQKNEKKK